MSTPRWVSEHILEAVVLDVTLATKDVIDVRGFTHLFIYPDSGGSIKYSVVLDEDETTHGPSPVTGSTDEIQEIEVEGNFYIVEAITADCHAHPVFLNQGGSDLSVEDEGTEKLAAATILDFKGAGVTVADDGGGQAGITIPGSAVSVEDEGSELTAAVEVIDFVGAGVTVTEPTADEVQVTIPAVSIGPIKDIALDIRTSGDITVNGTSWANLDTGLDLILAASAGDLVEVGVAGKWENETVGKFLDVVSVVSASPVNAWSQDGAETGTSEGVQSWVGVNAVAGGIGSSVYRALVSGDVSGGNVTLRFRVRTSSATNGVLRASTDRPLIVWAINYGQTFGDRIGKVDSARRASTDLSLTSTTWADLDSGLDLVLTAEVGDVVEVSFNARWTTSGAMSGWLDAGSLVSAAIVNVWSDGGAEAAGDFGVQGWSGLASTATCVGGSVMKTIVSGDLDGGTVTIRFRYKITSSGTKGINSDTTQPINVWAKNHGPVEA